MKFHIDFYPGAFFYHRAQRRQVTCNGRKSAMCMSPSSPNGLETRDMSFMMVSLVSTKPQSVLIPFPVIPHRVNTKQKATD
jgi:hypothetical protein